MPFVHQIEQVPLIRLTDPSSNASVTTMSLWITTLDHLTRDATVSFQPAIVELTLTE